MLLKLLLTVGVIIAVLYGARLFTSVARSEGGGQRRVDPPGGRGGEGGGGRGGPVDRPADPAKDHEACPVCGAYTTGEAKGACTREDCPYRG